MIETRYESRVEIQPAPVVNLLTNTNAQISLDGATAAAATLSRQSPFGGGTLNPPYNSAFRLDPNAANSDSWMNIGGDTGAAAMRNGMVAGRTYTARGTIYYDILPSGTAHARARKIVVFHRIGAAAYSTFESAAAPLVIGAHDVSLTFTLPVGTTEAFIRFYHGHTAGVIYWYKLRLSEGTQTDFFDGSFSSIDVGVGFDELEVGWDNALGLSTSYKADRTLNVALPDAEITSLSYDNLRVPWIEATIVAPLPSAAIIAMLDPRRSRDVILNFSVKHYTRGAGGQLDQLSSIVPMGYSEGTAGKLWLRTRRIDRVNRTITLVATSGEVRPEDKKRISDFSIDTGAADTQALWKYALTEAGEISAANLFSGVAVAAIPAGDRRRWMQGESASALFESELAALEARSYCIDVGLFRVGIFDQPPTWELTGSRLDDGDAGTLIALDEATTREGDWRDATLVKAQYIDGAGVQQTAWQRDNNGVNRKGAVTQISRAIPSATYAATITKRAAHRAGQTIRAIAQLDFKHKVGRRLTLHVQGDVFTIIPERVTYRPADGEMDIEGGIA